MALVYYLINLYQRSRKLEAKRKEILLERKKLHEQAEAVIQSAKDVKEKSDMVATSKKSRALIAALIEYAKERSDPEWAKSVIKGVEKELDANSKK